MKANVILLLTTAALLSVGAAQAQESQQQGWAHRIQVHGYAQIYAEHMVNKGKPNNTFAIRKSEIVATGQITDRWSMAATFQVQGSPTLKDLNLTYTLSPAFRVRVGQFKSPLSMENQISPILSDLVTGGSAPTVFFNGIGRDPLMIGTAGRDTGIEVAGDLINRRISYRLMLMNGEGMNRNDLTIGKSLGGALYVRPLSELELHTSFTYGEKAAADAYKGIMRGEEYKRLRLTGGAHVQAGNFNIIGEYYYGRDKETASGGAYANARYTFRPNWDLIVAGDWLRPDNTDSRQHTTAIVGVQYWFFQRCRMQLQYSYGHTSGLSLIGGNPPSSYHSHSLVAQWQFSF